MKQIRFHSVTANAVRKGSSKFKNELNKKTVVNFTQEQKPDGTFKRKAARCFSQGGELQG